MQQNIVNLNLEARTPFPSLAWQVLVWTLVFVGLFAASLYNYNLFHSLSEFFSIIIAATLFVIAWNSRRILDNNYLLFLGIGYLFVGGIDLVHTMAYKGMGVFTGYGPNLPTQLWVGARYLESATLLLAPLFLRRRLNPYLALGSFALAALLFLLSVFWGIFPNCFIEETGLTPFKIGSEYFICFILAAALVLLFKNRGEFHPKVLVLLAWSIILTIAQELSFTLYVDVYGLRNLIGHYLKILSFYLIYKAIIQTGLVRPYDVLFRNLKLREEAIQGLNVELQERIQEATEHTVELANANISLGESEERLRLLGDNLPDSAVYQYVHEADGGVRFLYFSAGVEKLNGVRVQDVLHDAGTLHRQIPPKYYEPLVEAEARSARDLSDFDMEVLMRRSDGQVRWMQLHSRPHRMSDGRTIWDGVQTDVTERKRVEEALQERTSELEYANRELEAFSYSVSHDLKAPVRAIEGFSEMLLGDHADKLDPEGIRLLNIITSNTKVMRHLIDDLLALSHLGRQQIRKSVINLYLMTNQVVDRLRAQTPERDFQLTLGDLPPALGDQSLLYQVLENLLSNAIKYTKPTKTAVIEVGGKDEENETIHYVKDNGIGFDERYAHKLYGVFQRLHGAHEYEGTGVGLAIVKRIIERHGGRVWAEGKVGEGATFYFALPKNGA